MTRPARWTYATVALSTMAVLVAALPVVATHRPETRVTWATSSSGATPAVLTGATSAVPPLDYTRVQGLSEPVFPATVRDVHRVPMVDGAELYVEVVRPDPGLHGEGPWPIIMEASPYHGTLADRDGTRIFSDPRDDEGDAIGLTGYFAPRGYAVAMVDLRGTGRSTGCLDHLGPNDAQDLKTVVEWAADQPWSTGAVGMTGHSYVGSTPILAAVQRPRGLMTIVPSAGLASMYDHQFHNGVPWFLQLAGPMYAYPLLATLRHLPPGLDTPFGPTGDDFLGGSLPYLLCGFGSSALTAGHGQLTGQYQGWHAQRDHRAGATAIDIPVFMVHGVNDNAARIPSAEWFFGHRFDRPGDKVWLGQWDHGSPGNTACPEPHVTCRFDQWQYALHVWFDKHLQGRDVDTGPPVEVFLNGDRVVTADRWAAPVSEMSLYPDAHGGGMGAGPGEHGSASFTSLPVPPTDSLGAVDFLTEPLAQDVVVVGLPRLRLAMSVVSAQLLNVVAGVYRVDGEGQRHVMGYCAAQPQLRHGLATPALVVPGERMELDPQCFTMAQHIPAGGRILLRISTSSPHHVSLHALEVLGTVFTGADQTRLTLPVVPGATLHDDVPGSRPTSADLD